jgi:hypothetical protein
MLTPQEHLEEAGRIFDLLSQHPKLTAADTIALANAHISLALALNAFPRKLT